MDRTIIDFTTQDQGTGTLARAVPRIDPTTEGTQQWDVDLTFGVDEAQAEHVAPALPQAGEYLARAREGKGSASITIKPAQRDLRLTMQATDEGVLLEAAAEIRHIKLNLTEKAQVYTARLRLYGLPPEAGATLLGCLGRSVLIGVQPAQLAMEFGGGAPLGSVVSGSDGLEDVFGVLTQKRGEQYVIDDFGVLYTVGKINAALEVDSEGLRLGDRYAEQVREMGDTPSWRDLVQAMASTGELNHEAVDLALEGKLPPEVGAVG